MDRTCFLGFRKTSISRVFSSFFEKTSYICDTVLLFEMKTSFLAIYSDFQKGTSPLTQMKKNPCLSEISLGTFVLINHSSRIVYITLHTQSPVCRIFFPGNIAGHIYGEISNYEYVFQFPLLVVATFYGNPMPPLLKAGSPKQRMSLSINHLPVCAHFTPSK